MTTIDAICKFMDEYAPRDCAEEWDNVGLLVGDRMASVGRLMTCLTVTPDSSQEAIERGADLVVSHHPLPFRPLTRLTTDETQGQVLIDLIRAGVAIYSPHTGFDSAAQGINQMLADKFQMTDARPLKTWPVDPLIGSARIAQSSQTAQSLADLIETAKSLFGLSTIHFVGRLQQPVKQVAFACGSGGSFLEAAIQAGCDSFITGETNFHTCLEAQARGVGLVLLGHFASERFAVEVLADVLNERFNLDHCWASQRESDPLKIA